MGMRNREIQRPTLPITERINELYSHRNKWNVSPALTCGVGPVIHERGSNKSIKSLTEKGADLAQIRPLGVFVNIPNVIYSLTISAEYICNFDQFYI